MEQVNRKKERENIGTTGKIMLFIITVISILIMFAIFFYIDNWRLENLPNQEKEPEDIITSGMLACVEMGCPMGTEYIGSSRGEVYHDCVSGSARSINPENRVCFSSADDAIARGYRA